MVRRQSIFPLTIPGEEFFKSALPSEVEVYSCYVAYIALYQWIREERIAYIRYSITYQHRSSNEIICSEWIHIRLSQHVCRA